MQAMWLALWKLSASASFCYYLGNLFKFRLAAQGIWLDNYRKDLPSAGSSTLTAIQKLDSPSGSFTCSYVPGRVSLLTGTNKFVWAIQTLDTHGMSSNRLAKQKRN